MSSDAAAQARARALTEALAPLTATVQWRSVSDSTQHDARAAGEALGALGGGVVVCVAAAQRAGRGRGGARWHGGERGLLVTIAAELDLDAALWPRSTLVAGAALAALAARWTGQDVRWKWPNDLMALRDGRWRKLGGCLAERVERAAAPPLWLLGVGLNQRRAGLPAEVDDGAVALDDLGRGDVADVDAIADIVRSVVDALRTWAGAMGKLDVAALERRMLLRGDAVRLDLGAGRSLDGTLRGLGDDGRLRLGDAAGAETLVLPLAIVGAQCAPPWHPPRPAAGDAGAAP